MEQKLTQIAINGQKLAKIDLNEYISRSKMDEKRDINHLLSYVFQPKRAVFRAIKNPILPILFLNSASPFK